MKVSSWWEVFKQTSGSMNIEILLDTGQIGAALNDFPTDLNEITSAEFYSDGGAVFLNKNDDGREKLLYSFQISDIANGNLGEKGEKYLADVNRILPYEQYESSVSMWVRSVVGSAKLIFKRNVKEGSGDIKELDLKVYD